MERQLLTYPIWERYSILSHVITNLSIRDRRHLFQLARTFENPDTLFPNYGFTLSEFAVWYTLGDARKKTKR